MKADIHPKLNHVVFVDTACGARFITRSTTTSKLTEVIDGVDHYVVALGITSASHPFYRHTPDRTEARRSRFLAITFLSQPNGAAFPVNAAPFCFIRHCPRRPAGRSRFPNSPSLFS
jgi:large subunit ribosomal protein L31